MGDSRGHWEGNTLVVDTTNVLDQDTGLGFIGRETESGVGIYDLHLDENLHLVERFTRIAPDTLLYQFTVDDPTAFTRPWSGEMSFARSTLGVVEYACNEGNYSMTDILAGARAAEKKIPQLLADRLQRFERHYEVIAKPFECRFTRDDLN